MRDDYHQIDQFDRESSNAEIPIDNKSYTGGYLLPSLLKKLLALQSSFYIMVLRGISNTLTEEKVSLPSIHLILLFILSIQLGPKRRSTSLFRRFN
jgi:hypothetical protein